MSWLYFIILSAFLWAVTNIFDKFLIEKRVDHPLVLTIFIRTISVVPVIFVIPFISFYIPGTEFIGWIFFAALTTAVGIAIYYKTIHTEEISRVIPLFQFIPVFVLFISFFFIGEVLDFFDYVGFVVLVIGGLVISTKRLLRFFRIERVLMLIALSSLFFAISDVTMKHVFSNIEYWSAFILLSVLEGAILLSLLGSGKIRKQARFYMGKLDLKGKSILISTSVITFAAQVTTFLAISLGPVTLVEAAMNTELVFTFLLVIILTMFFPHILKEGFDRKTTAQKIVGMILIIAGVLLTQVI